MIRLAQLYTGGVGAEIVRRLADHPQIELVAVLVHSPEKAGKDAGLLCGGAANGVITTTSLDEVLATKPDAAIYSGLNPDFPFIANLLRHGVNTYSGVGGFYLPGTPEFELIDEAGRAGNASFTGGGNIPGLVADVFPLFLAGYTGNITEIRCRQWNDVSTNPSAVQIHLRLGIGKFPDEDPEMARAVDEGWARGMRKSAQMVADVMGIELTDMVLESKRIALAEEDILLPNCGLLVKKGTVAGIEWNLVATSHGRPFYRLTNQQTAALRLGEGWRQTHEEPAWRIEIDGDPSIVGTFGWPIEADPGASNYKLNSLRAINTIPRLVAAAPGAVTTLDYPAPVASDGMKFARG